MTVIIKNWDEEVNNVDHPRPKGAEQRSFTQYILKQTNTPIEGLCDWEQYGIIMWLKNGFLHHREIDPKTGLTLPAMIQGKMLAWYKEGLRHREDGPAIIDPDDGTEDYWLNGKQFSKKEYEQQPLVIMHKEKKLLEQTIKTPEHEIKKVKV
jgi:hypothetical protein